MMPVIKELIKFSYFPEFIETESAKNGFRSKERRCISSALNTKLKDLRTVYGFEASEEQKNDYLAKFNRGSKKKLNYAEDGTAQTDNAQ